MTDHAGRGSPFAAPDRISLLGLRFFGHHGINRWERDNGQPFEVDLEVEMDLAAPGRTDRIEDGLDYTVLHAAAREVVEGPPRRLMESLAEAIAARALAHPPVRAVTVRVRKPRAGLPGIAGTVQVEIHRRRDV